MSYVVSIKRPISKHDLFAATEGDQEFSIVSEDDGAVVLTWARGEEQAMFNLYQGEIVVTTPSDGAWEKMNQLAQTLGAAVIGEEDDIPVQPEVRRGIFANRVTWIGWPVLVVLLSALLLWRW